MLRMQLVAPNQLLPASQHAKNATISCKTAWQRADQTLNHNTTSVMIVLLHG